MVLIRVKCRYPSRLDRLVFHGWHSLATATNLTAIYARRTIDTSPTRFLSNMRLQRYEHIGFFINIELGVLSFNSNYKSGISGVYLVFLVLWAYLCFSYYLLLVFNNTPPISVAFVDTLATRFWCRENFCTGPFQQLHSCIDLQLS